MGLLGAVIVNSAGVGNRAVQAKQNNSIAYTFDYDSTKNKKDFIGNAIQGFCKLGNSYYTTQCKQNNSNTYLTKWTLEGNSKLKCQNVTIINNGGHGQICEPCDGKYLLVGYNANTSTKYCFPTALRVINPQNNYSVVKNISIKVEGEKVVRVDATVSKGNTLFVRVVTGKKAGDKDYVYYQSFSDKEWYNKGSQVTLTVKENRRTFGYGKGDFGENYLNLPYCSGDGSVQGLAYLDGDKYLSSGRPNQKCVIKRISVSGKSQESYTIAGAGENCEIEDLFGDGKNLYYILRTNTNSATNAQGKLTNTKVYKLK